MANHNNIHVDLCAMQQYYQLAITKTTMSLVTAAGQGGPLHLRAMLTVKYSPHMVEHKK